MSHTDVINDRLERIAVFVRDHLYKSGLAAVSDQIKDDPDYRWHHTQRVSNYGKILAQAEGARLELVVAACLLHDIAVMEPGAGQDHGRIGAEIARPFLIELGYTPDEVDNICYSIASHVDVKDLETLEARVVTDADNIDRFGAYRAFLWVAQHLGNYQDLIPALIDRIDHLGEIRYKDALETVTGNAMFAEQLDFQLHFFEAIVKESDWAVVPKI